METFKQFYKRCLLESQKKEDKSNFVNLLNGALNQINGIVRSYTVRSLTNGESDQFTLAFTFRDDKDFTSIEVNLISGGKIERPIQTYLIEKD